MSWLLQTVFRTKTMIDISLSREMFCVVCKWNWIFENWDLTKSRLKRYIFWLGKYIFRNKKIYLWLWEIREVARYPSDVVAIQFSEENTTWQGLMRQLPFKSHKSDIKQRNIFWINEVFEHFQFYVISVELLAYLKMN